MRISILFTCSLQETLTASHNKMEAEVSSLRHQLNVEKSRNKQMQTDLQKELSVAFDENTKLTALLDGKVPKSKFEVTKLRWNAFSLLSCVISLDLIDAMELERTAANLTKELTASRDAEEALKGQLASLQVLPDQVQHLVKEVGFLTILWNSAREKKDLEMMHNSI